MLAPASFTNSPGISLLDRARGAYVGFAVGDALGATVEFMTAREIHAEFGVHRHIVGGGWLRLKPGQVTDDTQMALALGRAVLAGPDVNLRRLADSLVTWMRSRPVDIGHTCRRGLRRYALEGSLSAEPAADSGGNGAAVRNLPVALATLGDDDALARWSIAQAHITHHHEFSDRATLTFGRMLHALVQGSPAETCRQLADTLAIEMPVFRFDPWPGHTSGYIVDTTQTVFEAFFATRSFEDCVVRVVNRGGDADTTGALAGQLAGACYGEQAIPAAWLRRLDPAVLAEARDQAVRLVARTLPD
jgi:ADP-ribosyl-[dinitrogen reductase] hydrolase